MRITKSPTDITAYEPNVPVLVVFLPTLLFQLGFGIFMVIYLPLRMSSFVIGLSLGIALFAFVAVMLFALIEPAANIYSISTTKIDLANQRLIANVRFPLRFKHTAFTIPFSEITHLQVETFHNKYNYRSLIPARYNPFTVTHRVIIAGTPLPQTAILTSSDHKNLRNYVKELSEAIGIEPTENLSGSSLKSLTFQDLPTDKKSSVEER